MGLGAKNCHKPDTPITHQYLDAVDAFYASLEAGRSLDGLARMLGGIVGADAGDIVSEDPGTRDIRTCASYGFDPVYRDLYCTEYLGENPWVDALERGPKDRLRTDIENRCGYRASAYFRDWVRPQGFEHSLGARLSAVPGRTVWIGFVRGTGARPFSGQGVATRDRLMPHLNRVIALADRFRPAVPTPATVALGAEAAMILGPDRRILALNAAAERLIDGPGRTGRGTAGSRWTTGTTRPGSAGCMPRPCWSWIRRRRPWRATARSVSRMA